jgi:hypothetical protein
MRDRRGPRSLGMVHAAGLSWPLSEDMTDAVFEAKLFADAGTKQSASRPALGCSIILCATRCEIGNNSNGENMKMQVSGRIETGTTVLTKQEERRVALALYLRVSTSEQTTRNQHRDWKPSQNATDGSW